MWQKLREMILSDMASLIIRWLISKRGEKDAVALGAEVHGSAKNVLRRLLMQSKAGSWINN